MREGALDHRCLQDGGDDLERAATVRAVFEVNLEDMLEQPGPADARRLAASCDAPTSSCAPAGTTSALGLAFGASTPCKRIRCNRGCGTSAASRYMNSSGDTMLSGWAWHIDLTRRFAEHCGQAELDNGELRFGERPIGSLGAQLRYRRRLAVGVN